MQVLPLSLLLVPSGQVVLSQVAPVKVELLKSLSKKYEPTKCAWLKFEVG
jgi:hypothetical protein